MSALELSNKILTRFKCSLSELADTLPSAFTTDAFILEGRDCYSDGETEKAFHHLSLSHSTSLYHNNVKHSLKANLKKNPEVSSEKTFPKLERPSNAEETLDILKALPSDWTIVQITSGYERIWRAKDEPIVDPIIYISRATCGPSPSLLIQKVEPPSKKNELVGYLQELSLIKHENKVITQYSLNDHNKYILKREDINFRMKNLVRSMDNGWLRYWSSLLQGSLHATDEQKLDSLVEEVLVKHNISLPKEKCHFLKLMVAYPPPAHITSKPLQKTKSSIMIPQDFYDEFPLKAGVAFLLEKSVRSPLVSAVIKSFLDAQKEILSIRKSLRNPLILILDKEIVTLPWEMLSITKNQSITRMPSLHSLHLLYLHHTSKPDSLLMNGIDPHCGFYFLDPDNNLPRSQKRLLETFENTKWQGIIGKRPTTDEFKEVLSSKDIVVYTGHGSGSQYLPGSILESLECRALVFLYGCSSVRLNELGSIPDPSGTVLNYLIAHCPCVVGMLWEVMDKDTDLLTKEMLRAIMGEPGSPNSPLEDPPTDVGLLVAKARPLCDWYMISASLVAYGLPLHIVHNDR